MGQGYLWYSALLLCPRQKVVKYMDSYKALKMHDESKNYKGLGTKWWGNFCPCVQKEAKRSAWRIQRILAVNQRSTWRTSDSRTSAYRKNCGVNRIKIYFQTCEGKDNIWERQRGFTKGKSCLTSMNTVYHMWWEEL